MGNIVNYLFNVGNYLGNLFNQGEADEGEVIQMACLGRSFTLGMLYDCRKDIIIPGMTLWDNETLKSACASEDQVGSGFKITAEDSLESKAFDLGVDASLKLSFLSKLVEVQGAAKYLDNRASSMQQSRVSLKYWTTTKFNQLTMDQLGKIQYSEVFSQKVATHVVTGILYGADAFFVFDRKIMDGEDKREVSGKMEMLIKGLPGISDIKGDPNINLNQKDREEANKFECTFHGDLSLPNNPTTFDSAVKIYQKLPELLNKPVPKQVWLYPLTKLDSTAAKVVHEISTGLVNRAQEVMEEILQLEIQASDLMKTDVCSCFSGLHHQLSRFKGRMLEYKATLSKKLNHLLPNIREGGEKESQLADLFKSKEASDCPFNSDQLSSWMKSKQEEIKVLGTHLKAMRKIKAIKLALKAGDLDAIVSDLDCDHVICFSFKVIVSQDQFLERMSAWLQGETSTTSSAIEKQIPWFKNKTLMKTIRQRVRQFTAFAEANKGKEKTVFVVNDDSMSSNESEEDVAGAEILLYQYGNLESEPLDLPLKPNNLSYVDNSVTHCSVQLKWSKPEQGAGSVTQYTVCYRQKECSQENCISKMTKKRELFLTVEGLQANTAYQFMVRADCRVGSSMYTDLLEIRTNRQNHRLAIKMKNSSTPITNEKESQDLSIFQLPQTEIFQLSSKMIRKVDIGEPPIKVIPHKVLMVVGATGAGKSTLINGIVNFILGVSWKDDFRFKLIVDQVQTQAKSVTNEITAYTIYQMEGSCVPYNLTIIDTPGFGDTSGLERNKKITAQIKEFFSFTGKNGIDHLDGIGFVTQSALVRLTPTQQYIFDSILSIFGKDVANNIFIMVTFSDGQKPPVITAIKEAGIPCSESFKFNNSALYADNSNSDVDDANFDEMFWKMGISSFKTFFATFEKAESVSLVMTRDVLIQREKLETAVIGLQRQMNECLAKMEVLHQHKRVLKYYEADIKANKNFTFETKQPAYKIIKLERGDYVTNCLVCRNTCHHPCYINNDDEKWRCAAMTGDNSNAKCNVCPSNCSWTNHKNTGERFELHYETVIQTNEDLRKKYNDASSGKSSYETMIENSQSQLEEAHAELLFLVDDIRQCLKILGEIALKPNPLTQMEYIQLLINSEKRQAKEGWYDRVRYLEISKDQAALLAAIKDDEDIDERIKEEVSKQNQGWQERVDKLKSIRRIKHEVEQSQISKEGKKELYHYVD